MRQVSKLGLGIMVLAKAFAWRQEVGGWEPWGQPRQNYKKYQLQQQQHRHHISSGRLRFCWGLRGGNSVEEELNINAANEGVIGKRPTIQEPLVWGQRKRALILMDVFSAYHGNYLSHLARKGYGVATVNVLSDYMKGYFAKEMPDQVDEWGKDCMPSDDDESLEEWKSSLKDIELVGIYCESDSGLADAEIFGTKLNLTCHNGFNAARRDKFLMIETIRAAGLPVVQQKLCTTLEEAVSFANSLGMENSNHNNNNNNNNNNNETFVVVKPVRGVASDDVHLCRSMGEVEQAFHRIHGSTIFGSPREKHQSVLVQEFAVGQEFAIDIVSKDGEHKVATLWIYDKRPANGAPFVYYSTEVYEGEAAPIIYDYVSKCLDALDIRWGLTHTEVIMTQDGPRLVEVNCRQHNMDFAPLQMECFGYNAFDMLSAAYLGDGHQSLSPVSPWYPPGSDDHQLLDWDVVPILPSKRMNAAMMHLSSFVEGTLLSVNETALNEIQSMESVLDLEIYRAFLELGGGIHKTVDIRTDCGWVQLVNPDPEAFTRDYNRIIELMPSFFQVE